MAASTTTRASFTQPALVGGLVMGVLSALPIVYFGNACCCMWVISGGVIAAYVFQQNSTTAITPADGALVGLLAGLAGAVVHLILSVPIDLVMAPFERSMAQRFLGMTGDMSPGFRDVFEQAIHRSEEGGIGLLLVRRLVLFMGMLFVGAIFSTLGGLIGALIFKKSTPPGVIDLPPAQG